MNNIEFTVEIGDDKYTIEYDRHNNRAFEAELPIYNVLLQKENNELRKKGNQLFEKKVQNEELLTELIGNSINKLLLTHTHKTITNNFKEIYDLIQKNINNGLEIKTIIAEFNTLYDTYQKTSINIIPVVKEYYDFLKNCKSEKELKEKIKELSNKLPPILSEEEMMNLFPQYLGHKLKKGKKHNIDTYYNVFSLPSDIYCNAEIPIYLLLTEEGYCFNEFDDENVEVEEIPDYLENTNIPALEINRVSEIQTLEDGNEFTVYKDYVKSTAEELYKCNIVNNSKFLMKYYSNCLKVFENLEIQSFDLLNKIHLELTRNTLNNGLKRKLTQLEEK